MDSNFYERVREIINEASNLNISEIENDILNLKAHDYDISIDHVGISMERVKIYLQKNGLEDLARELDDIIITTSMHNNLHQNFSMLISRLRKMTNYTSPTLDYIQEAYNIRNRKKHYENVHNALVGIMNKKKYTSMKHEQVPKPLNTPPVFLKSLYMGEIERNQLEVLLMSNILFTSNRAYIGKIDEYLSRVDINIEYELQNVLEDVYDDRVIQYLTEKHEVADDIFSNHEDLERYLEIVPEDMILTELDDMTLAEFNAWKLEQDLINSMLESTPDNVDYLEAKELAEDLIKAQTSHLGKPINYGANSGIINDSEGIKTINPVKMARFIRNALAHHKWRFCENGYVHMWNIKKEEDSNIPIIDFNIKIPVEVLLGMIKKFIEKIFTDVKYLTITDLTGNYPKEYQEATLEELVDKLVSDTVILPKDRNLVYQLTKEAIDKETSFYNDEFCMNRAKVILEYIISHRDLSPRDKQTLEDYINHYLDEFIDKDLDDILEILEDEEIGIDFEETRDEIEENITDIDLHFLSDDINIYALDFISTQFIEPLQSDYLLIVDQIKYFDHFSRIGNREPSTDLNEILPKGLRTRELDENIKASTLIRTLLTLMFVHTEIDNKLLETLDFSTLELTELGVKLSKENLEEKMESLKTGAANQIALYETNIKDARNTAKTIGEQIHDKMRKGEKVKAKKKIIFRDKLLQIQKNRALIKEELEKLERSTRFIKENENNPMLIYSPIFIFNRIRNSLAHGNIIIPDNIDFNNLDETIITIVDKDPENDNAISFEGTIKLGELLRVVCKPELMIPTFNLDTRYGKTVKQVERIIETTENKRRR